MGKKKLYKVGIWGQYGDGGPIADGQAVRTTIITEEIERRYGKENVLRLNSNQWYNRPISFLRETIKLIVKSESVVIFPADNGFKVIVPIFYYLNKIFKRKLYDVVIGGYLPKLLSVNPEYVKYLKKFDALFVQTPNIKHDLEEQGLSNIKYITNLKRLNRVCFDELKVNNKVDIKLCYLSRITKDKGIEDAVEAIKLANKKLGQNYITMDVYGMVPQSYEQIFKNLLDENNSIISYKGVVHYNNTVEVLKNYFALVFPTYFHGEGFPGCFVDAFSSGIPVIATDWLYNSDIIKDGQNGILVPIQNPSALCDAILKLYENRDEALRYGQNNLLESEQFNPESVLKEFFAMLDNKTVE